MLEDPVDHVGDGLEAAVGMPGGALGLARGRSRPRPSGPCARTGPGLSGPRRRTRGARGSPRLPGRLGRWSPRPPAARPPRALVRARGAGQSCRWSPRASPDLQTFVRGVLTDCARYGCECNLRRMQRALGLARSEGARLARSASVQRVHVLGRIRMLAPLAAAYRHSAGSWSPSVRSGRARLSSVVHCWIQFAGVLPCSRSGRGSRAAPGRCVRRRPTSARRFAAGAWTRLRCPDPAPNGDLVSNRLPDIPRSWVATAAASLDRNSPHGTYRAFHT